MRRISTKVQPAQDKVRKLQLKTADNQYYLPHPQIRVVKTPIKDSTLQNQKDKHFLKYSRKGSHNGPARTYSTALFKLDHQNLSKQHDLGSSHKNNAAKKVQSRKNRCVSSNCETPRKAISKSGFKLQLNGMKKEGVPKRINLKLQTPSTTKKAQKAQLQQMNFDTYYNNEGTGMQSKTTRQLKRVTSSQSHFAGDSNQFALMFSRCKRVIEDYQDKLEAAKKENQALRQQNMILKGHRDTLKKSDF